MMTCFVDDRIGIAELAVNEFHLAVEQNEHR